MNQQKFPRTLNEAFGPYTSQEFDDLSEIGPTRGEWLLVIAGMLLIAGAFVLAFFMFS